MIVVVKLGFTLIELLVVISIISLLASIVLASLGSARDGGKDAAIASQMAQMRLQAELYRSEKGNFYDDANDGEVDDSLGECFTGSAGSVFIDTTTNNDLEQLIRSTWEIASEAGNRMKCRLGTSSNDNWALAFPTFEGGSGTGYCVDSRGSLRPITHDFDSPGVPMSGIVCP